MNIKKKFIAVMAAGVTACAAVPQDVTWTSYGGNFGGGRYSDLRDIGPGNVASLEVAWTYHTGEASLEAADKEKAVFEATPIVVDGVLFVSTPFNRVIALDAKTGSERWRFDPQLDRTAQFSEVTSRGVSTWLDKRVATDAVGLGNAMRRPDLYSSCTGRSWMIVGCCCCRSCTGSCAVCSV